MRILILSDLHCGSVYGLSVPEFRLSDGSVHHPNPMQEWLWEKWCLVADRIGRVDVAVINGDVIDGSQRAQRGTELSAVMLEDQAEMAVHAIRKMLGRSGRRVQIFGVHGTEYHDQYGGAYAERVYSRLGAIPYNGLGPGRWGHDVLNLNIHSRTINITHTIRSTTTLIHDLRVVQGPDVIVRSHLHKFMCVEVRGKMGLITPCWQLQTKFMRKRSLFDMWPDIGAVVLNVDRSGDVRVERWIFEPPKMPVHDLEEKWR